VKTEGPRSKESWRECHLGKSGRGHCKGKKEEKEKAVYWVGKTEGGENRTLVSTNEKEKEGSRDGEKGKVQKVRNSKWGLSSLG